MSQFLVWLCTHPEVRGLENFPKQGPVLIVINDLGDADAVLGLAYAPVCIDTLAKQELYDIPIIGALMHAYGMIWLQRGASLTTSNTSAARQSPSPSANPSG